MQFIQICQNFLNKIGPHTGIDKKEIYVGRILKSGIKTTDPPCKF